VVGTIISHYRILEKLGGGGMGVARQYEERAALIPIKVIPVFDRWRSDPVYQEVVDKLALP
jgi:hypothetical protein